MRGITRFTTRRIMRVTFVNGRETVSAQCLLSEPRTKLEIVFSSLSARQKYHAIPPMTKRGFPGTKWMSVTPVVSFRKRDSKAKTACSHFVSNRF